MLVKVDCTKEKAEVVLYSLLNSQQNTKMRAIIFGDGNAAEWSFE